MKTDVFVQQLLEDAGIRVGGTAPSDITVHDARFYDRVVSYGSLGLGESYMDGWWDCDDLARFIERLLVAGIQERIYTWRTMIGLAPRVAMMRLKDLGAQRHAHKIGATHYDVGNDLYRAMLDKRMTYTCGYWRDAEDLDAAQEAKFDLICRKIGLKSGMRVLDIGCGWGSFMKYAAEKYDVSCVGVTVSKEQISLGEKLCHGLPVEFRYADYRDIAGETFDRIISIGMFEHVGVNYYETFFRKAKTLLRDDGLMLLHTIGNHYNTQTTDPWIDKYIFPGGVIPSLEQVARAFELHFVMEDWHNFGADYARTLHAWHDNVSGAWDELATKNPKYTKQFQRMWRYYLLSCAGSFSARHIQLWQIVLSPHGVPGGYHSVR